MDIKHAIIKEYRRARHYYDTVIRLNNEKAYRYFNEEEPTVIDPDVEEYFQNIVSPDVANVVEHTLADIMPAVASESPVIFPPQSPEDEMQAQVETNIVNNIFMQQSNGFIELLTAIKESFIQRVGAIEVQTYKKATVSYIELTDTNLDIITSLIEEGHQNGEQVEIIRVNGELIEDLDENPIDSVLSVELRKTSFKNQLYIESFPPDELLVVSETDSLDLDRASFVARERVLDTSKLIELGYPRNIIESLPTYAVEKELRPNRQRRHDLQDYDEGAHDSIRPIHVVFCYMRIDEDNDGIAELRKIVLAGNLPEGATILEDKPVECQPYAVGTPFIYPHRVHGISFYDKIKQVQQLNTKVIRQLLTAGERAVRGRLGVVGNAANPTDIKTTQFGGIVRMSVPNGIIPIPTDAFPSEVAGLLETIDKRRRESGGSAVDKATEEIAVGGDTAHGLERIMSAIEQLNSLVAKTLAETLLRQVYVKIHYNLRQYFNQPINEKVGGNWVQAIPSMWPVRTHVVTALGLTTGDRFRQASAYNQLIDTNLQLMEKGSILVNDQTLHRLLINRANALMVPNGYSYYIDPASEEGQQAAQQQQQAAQEQAQREEAARKEQLNLLPQVEAIKGQNAAYVQQLKNQVAELKVLLDKAAKDNDNAVEYDQMKLKLVELNAEYDQEPVPDAVPSKSSL